MNVSLLTAVSKCVPEHNGFTYNLNNLWFPGPSISQVQVIDGHMQDSFLPVITEIILPLFCPLFAHFISGFNDSFPTMIGALKEIFRICFIS